MSPSSPNRSPRFLDHKKFTFSFYLYRLLRIYFYRKIQTRVTVPSSLSLLLAARLRKGRTCAIRRLQVRFFCITLGLIDILTSIDDTENELPTSQLETIIAAAPANHPLPVLRNSLAFIRSLQNASLDNDSLPPLVLQRLRTPLQHRADMTDPDLRCSIKMFLGSSTASEEVYTTMRDACMERNPDNQILSLDQVKRKVAELSGVSSVVHDMCQNSCLAYTGPFADLESCPECSLSRYDPLKAGRTNKKVPRQQFHTIPLGPQLQALKRSDDSSRNVGHRHRTTQHILDNFTLDEHGKKVIDLDCFDDFYSGSDYLGRVANGDITKNSFVVMLSLDGCQLYEHKTSDCWIYIWVILDLPPDLRYKKKHVLIGGFIPGPNHPKNLDSFLHPGLHHVSALQKEGLPVWDSLTTTVIMFLIFVALVLADGPGIATVNGFVGHQGMYCCRLYCPIQGRRKPAATKYYPALLKPDDFTVAGCNHDDIDAANLPAISQKEYCINLAWLLQSRTDVEYELRRKLTGIAKPSILSGLSSKFILGIPSMFPADLMHLVCLNLTELLLMLWTGTMRCDPLDNLESWDWAVLRGPIWVAHGHDVARCRSFIPGLFDCPPRNPVEKMNSGYKAWEWLLYVFGIGPALLRGILPDIYWRNYCHLVYGIRLLHQHSITRAQLLEAHQNLIDFHKGFEELYVQRKTSRLHFMRPCIHAVLHIAPETPRIGPPIYHTQWTMERTIGNLGEEVKQPSNPYENLSLRGVRRSQVNALKAMVPDLDPAKPPLPCRSQVCADGYVLLRARDRTARLFPAIESLALRNYLEGCGAELLANWVMERTYKWARLLLPNGHIARSAWKEQAKPLLDTRIARCVKVCYLLQPLIHIHHLMHMLAQITRCC